MQSVLIIPEQEFRRLVARVEQLEASHAPEPPTAENLLTVRQAAERLGLKPCGVRNARRQGRLKGFLINEKEWGFYPSELDRYLRRYQRQRPAA